MRKYLTRLCKAIASERFNEENYRAEKTWYGKRIQTVPVFDAYNTIGFEVLIEVSETHEWKYSVRYDYILKKLTINDKSWKDYINLLYLEENDIWHSENPVWEKKPRSVELETYTEGGEDMIFNLEEPTASQLQGYIDDFDINEMVSMWWENGKPGDGVPFDNMKEHYEDYENWLEWLQSVCDKMPF